MIDADKQIADDLRIKVASAFSRAIGPATEVALLDTPSHRNLGDTFILAGELRVLKLLEKRVVYAGDTFRTRFDIVKSLPSDVPILLHGGGNLGGLHPEHDAFRADLFRRFPKRKYVFLPQTSYFPDDTRREKLAASATGLKSCTFIARSLRTQEELTSLGAGGVIYGPDAAFGLGPLSLSAPRTPGVRVLKRDDVESIEEDLQAPTPIRRVSDWEFTPMNAAAWRATGRLNRLVISQRLPDPLVIAAQQAQMMARVRLNMEAAKQLLGRSAAVASDRLHVHIYCALAGIPHAVSDNSYGKISEIFHEYSGRFSTAHLTERLSEAIKTAHALSPTAAQAD